jgi:hypothetical protein
MFLNTMSSEQEIVLYKKLYVAIEDIFNRKGLTKKLNPLDIEQDKILISIIFRSISTTGNEDFINWNEEEWIESMKVPEICMLSFLYKKQLTLYKIYNMTSNIELKDNLLVAYKKLVHMVKFLESLEKASNLFVDTSVDIDKIKNKQLQIALNIKNYKDPKNLANIIDLLYHKQFRDNVLKNFLKGIDKVDLSVLKSFADENVSYSGLIEKYLTQDNITKLLIFLMKIDIKGDVFANERLYNSVKEYINEVIKHSDQIQKLFDHIEETVSDCQVPYKNKINLKLIDNTKDFIQECNRSSNKITITKDIFSSFDSFNNGEYVKFKSLDLVRRIRDIIFILIQKVMEFASLPKDEKVALFNEYLKKYVISNFDNDEDFLTIDKNFINKNNNDDKSLKTELSLKMKNLIKELVDSLADDEDIKDIISIKNEFIETLKYVTQLDFSNIEKKEFNVINNLVEKLFKKPGQLKFLIIKFLNADIIKKYVTKFEEDSSIRINPEIKKKIAEKSMAALEELVNILVDTKDLQDLEKFVLFVSKGVDYLFYYALKLKSSDLKQKIVKQRKVIAQKR